jgi:hypothetical protein
MYTIVGLHLAIGIVAGYRLDGQEFELRWGARFLGSIQTGSEAHPVSFTIVTGSLAWG